MHQLLVCAAITLQGREDRGVICGELSDSVKCHHRHTIVRKHPFPHKADGAVDAAPGLLDPARQQDNDERSMICRFEAGCANPCARCGEILLVEIDNFAWTAVFRNREVLLAEIGDRLALAIDDRHGQGHHGRPAAKHRRLLS